MREEFEKIIDHVEQISSKNKSTDLFKQSFESFAWKKGRVKRNFVLLCICFVPAFSIGIAQETKILFYDSLGDILGAFLTILGIVFTGYTVFQAIINNELLIKLFEIESSVDVKQSKLQETNESFAMLMMLNLVVIISSMLLRITVSGIDSDFLIFESLILSNVLAIILILLYYFIIAIVLCELKSFIFNIYQLFNLSSVTRILEIMKIDKDQ